MKKLLLIVLMICVSDAPAAEWRNEPIWHDGLAERAVYSASRVIYGQPRPYQAIFYTNKEQHDKSTLTKARQHPHPDSVEVFKHNQIEVINTPNYPYSYVTTSHLDVSTLELTRLDCSSQEHCGTSFKQYQRAHRDERPGWDYRAFSYMPESGWRDDFIEQQELPTVPADSLPLILRDFDFEQRRDWRIALLPSQKSNQHTLHQPVNAVVRYAGEEDDTHRLELFIGDQLAGTYWMARDRLHVMVRYAGADGQSYDLESLERVDYWTRAEE